MYPSRSSAEALSPSVVTFESGSITILVPPGTPQEQMRALATQLQSDVARGGASELLVAIKQGLEQQARLS
jgi:hypothetical protein